jgi:hypothetical protein
MCGTLTGSAGRRRVLGTAFLTLAIIGSGIAASRLSQGESSQSLGITPWEPNASPHVTSGEATAAARRRESSAVRRAAAHASQLAVASRQVDLKALSRLNTRY